MGFGVWGVGCRFWNFGLRTDDLWFRAVLGLGFRVKGEGFKVYGSGLVVQGLRFGV